MRYVEEQTVREDIEQEYIQTFMDMQDLAHARGRQVAMACNNWIWQGDIVKITASHIRMDKASMILKTGSIIDGAANSAESLVDGMVAIDRGQIEAVFIGKEVHASTGLIKIRNSAEA